MEISWIIVFSTFFIISVIAAYMVGEIAGYFECEKQWNPQGRYRKPLDREALKKRAEHTSHFGKLFALNPDSEDEQAHKHMLRDDEGKIIKAGLDGIRLPK